MIVMDLLLIGLVPMITYMVMTVTEMVYHLSCKD